MLFISLNVNGIRAALRRGLKNFVETSRADFILLQETKLDEPPKDEIFPNYRSVWNVSKVRGYAGVAIFYKKPPQRVICQFSSKPVDAQGRMIALEYSDFMLVNVYVPNSQGALDVWYRRLAWDEAFFDFLVKLDMRKPVIVGGDFNVAHKEEDIYEGSYENFGDLPGFREEERENFDNLIAAGFVDTFRLFHAGRGHYTWWPNGNRQSNKGRRLDYFLIPRRIKAKIMSSEILTAPEVSDHAGIAVEIEG